MPDTRAILSLIYRDYICEETEKEILLKKDNEEINKYEEKLKEKYNIDNILKNRRKEQEKTQYDKPIQIARYKESIIKRIFNKIKRIFFKN